MKKAFIAIFLMCSSLFAMELPNENKREENSLELNRKFLVILPTHQKLAVNDFDKINKAREKFQNGCELILKKYQPCFEKNNKMLARRIISSSKLAEFIIGLRSDPIYNSQDFKELMESEIIDIDTKCSFIEALREQVNATHDDVQWNSINNPTSLEILGKAVSTVGAVVGMCGCALAAGGCIASAFNVLGSNRSIREKLTLGGACATGALASGKWAVDLINYTGNENRDTISSLAYKKYVIEPIEKAYITLLKEKSKKNQEKLDEQYLINLRKELETKKLIEQQTKKIQALEEELAVLGSQQQCRQIFGLK